MRTKCKAESPDCPEHDFPDDWQIGGATGEDPRIDPRWMPRTYTYLDGNLQECYVTQVPMCDEEALDGFTHVQSMPGNNPVFLSRKRSGEPGELLPYTYDAASDTFSEIKK